MLDWQFSRIASPVHDLCYFLLGATTKHLRDRYLEQFIVTYYQSLSDTISLCGSDAEKLFTFDQLQQQFKQFGKFGLLTAPTVIKYTISDSIVDIDSFSENFNPTESSSETMATFNEKTQNIFKERFTDAFFDASQYGWI